MKIVVDDKIPYLQGVLERYFDTVTYRPGKQINRSDVQDADALLIRTRTCCDRSLLEGSRVKVIATATIGYDHIDREYCKQNGIAWFNAPGCNAFGVVQYVLSALSHLALKHSFSLKDKTLGIVGVGEVGKRIAKVAPYLGLKVLLNDPPRERSEGSANFVDLQTICSECDIVTFHVPLLRGGADKTFHLANTRFFESFSKPKILINASRGEVVETNALIEAIENGKVSHAAVDVWENEPSISRELLQRAAVATPHIAGYSLEGKANGTAMAVNRILEFFGMAEDKPWYPADLPKLPSIVQLECHEDDEKSVLKSILKTYSIMDDDARLRRSPETFEEQRGCYGVRREISYYHVAGLENGELKNEFKGLTFEV